MELQQWKFAAANSSHLELLCLDTRFMETSNMPVISIPTDYKNKTTPYMFACPLEARWMGHTLIGVSGKSRCSRGGTVSRYKEIESS